MDSVEGQPNINEPGSDIFANRTLEQNIGFIPTIGSANDKVANGKEQEAELRNIREQLRIKVPIRAAILDRDNMTEEDMKTLSEFNTNAEFLAEAGFGSEHRFTSTGINEKNKYSKALRMCTGVVAVGKLRDSGKEVSFMTHNLFPTILRSKRNVKKLSVRNGASEKVAYNDIVRQYGEAFREQLKNFYELVDKDSIDVIGFGGQAYGRKGIFEDSSWKEYESAIKYQSQLIKEELGSEPTIIAGPQDGPTFTGYGETGTDVYLDTQNRRLYIVRSEQKNAKRNENYKPENLEKEKKNW